MKVPRLRSVLVVIVTLMLVVAAGPAHAEITATDCEQATSKEAMASVSGLDEASDASGALITCLLLGLLSDPSEDVSKTDAYQQSLGIRDSADTFGTVMHNRLESSRSLAWSEAKFTLIQELNNGSSTSTSQDNANASVADYVTRLERNSLEDWDVKMDQLEYVKKETNLSTRLRLPDHTDSPFDDSNWGLGTVKINLYNGTATNVSVYYYVNSGTAYWNGPLPGHGVVETYPETFDGYSVSGSTPISSARNATILTKDPDTGSWTEIVASTTYPGKFRNQTRRAAQIGDDVRANMNAFADDVFAQYEAGDLNVTDVLSPTQLAARAGSDWNSTGSYQFAAIQLAAMGEGGDLNATFQVTTNRSDALYEGQLFYTGDDVERLENGTTYDTATLNGSFVMAVLTSDGNTTIREWGGPTSPDAKVTIQGLHDADTGEAKQNTTVVQYNYKDANASRLASELDRLRELRDHYEDQLAGIGPGTGQGSSPVLVGVGLTLMAILAARARRGS